MPDDGSAASSYINLDARSLRGLAHPLRMQILGILRLDGPSTATSLADQLGVRPGTTSWHLQKLAEHGFIEEVADRGTRRDRWWRVVIREVDIDAGEFMEDPELAGPTQIFLAEVINHYMARAVQFVYEEWPKPWRKAAILESNESLVLSADSLAALRSDLRAVLQRYLENGGEPAEDTEQVAFQMQGFPYRQGQQATGQQR